MTTIIDLGINSITTIAIASVIIGFANYAGFRFEIKEYAKKYIEKIDRRYAAFDFLIDQLLSDSDIPAHDPFDRPDIDEGDSVHLLEVDQ